MLYTTTAMSFVIFAGVVLTCGSQVARYVFVRNYHAALGWTAALFLGVSLALVLSYVDKMVPTP